MKFQSLLILITFAFFTICEIDDKVLEHNTAMETYLDLLSNKFVDDIFEKHDIKMAKRILKKSKTVNRILERKLEVKKTSKYDLNSVIPGKSKMNKRERKLYESLTNSYLLGNNDDVTTINSLSVLGNQQKSMQNFQIISGWMNDIENNLDDLRDTVNRRLADMSTGLQRRNMLLSHYNDVGNVAH